MVVRDEIVIAMLFTLFFIITAQSLDKLLLIYYLIEEWSTTTKTLERRHLSTKIKRILVLLLFFVGSLTTFSIKSQQLLDIIICVFDF